MFLQLSLKPYNVQKTAIKLSFGKTPLNKFLVWRVSPNLNKILVENSSYCLEPFNKYIYYFIGNKTEMLRYELLLKVKPVLGQNSYIIDRLRKFNSGIETKQNKLFIKFQLCSISIFFKLFKLTNETHFIV